MLVILLFDFHVHFWFVLVKKAHLKDLSERRPHWQKTLRGRRTDTSSAPQAPDGLILGHLLVHSVDKTYVLILTVEWIWLLLLNILSFNFFLRLTAAILSKQWQSYTAFLLEVARILFLQLFLPIIVHLFAYSISVPQILLTPRWVSRRKDEK